MCLVGASVSPGRNGSSLQSSRFLLIAFIAVSVGAQAPEAWLPAATSSVFSFYRSLIHLLGFALSPVPTDSAAQCLCGSRMAAEE